MLTDLECSHHELRGAVILAGKRIIKPNFGKRDDKVLVKLREVLTENAGGRQARRAEGPDSPEVAARLLQSAINATPSHAMI
jgi:hypothetical protein